ncbi:MAG: rhodanese-like domain-containing protein [Acidimicrobiia bacterium]|nr:rhodanese-like domain-containing protein [Acidimicrobiia bacterium]NNC74179.1 rhodanese-like domain-containing protein [Acidimicrobiia bacterium]
MKRLIALLVLVGLVVAACGGSATATFDLVSPAEAQEILDDPPSGLVVLDVRTPEEFSGPHLSDSVNIDFYDSYFQSRLDVLDKDTPYLIYCNSGNRSGTTIDIMKDLGFSEVYDVDGGITAWLGAGLPTITE